jgi:Na+/proline symporter
VIRRVALLVLACLAVARPAHAYLDPGTGSMLLSAIIGFVAAVALAVKMFWFRVVGLRRGSRREPPS